MGINTLINSLPGGVSNGGAVNAAQGQAAPNAKAKGLPGANRTDKASSATGADSFSACLGSSVAAENAQQAGSETVAPSRAIPFLHDREFPARRAPAASAET